MTVSKCFQLIMYGLIAGYELPRMASRFKNLQVPENACADVPISPSVPLREFGLPCNQGKELEPI